MSEVFVGRESEIETLEQALAVAALGRGRLVLISGEPGIGKTRVAEELSRRAESRGAAVAWGRSWEGEGTPAFWPWLQALRRVEAAPELRAAVDAARSESREVAALLGDGVREAAAATADPQQARFRLFDAMAELLRAVAAVTPLVIVLDDLHAADVSTLLLLRFVARDLRATRILIVGTLRDTSFQATPQVKDLLAKIAREALLVPLARLTRDELARWVDAAAPPLASRVDTVFATSEGNPLFVEELLASAKRHPGSPVTSQPPMPLGIREAIRAHLALLSRPAQELLVIASVLGRELSLATLLAIAEGAEHDARALVEEAAASSVLLDAGDGVLRFSHVLLRDELYASASPARRAELHRRAAERLAREPRTRAASAHHALLGARERDAAEVALVVRAGMREASARLAFEDAAELGHRALALIGAHLDPREECALRIETGEAWILGGSERAGQDECARAAEIAASIGDSDLLARAALVHATEIVLGRRPSIIDILRRALAALPDRDALLRAEVMSRLAVAIIPTLPEDPEDPWRLGQDAIAMARRLGDEATLFQTLRLSVLGFDQALGAGERLAVIAESIALARRLGQLARVVPLLGWQVCNYLDLGDPDGAAREADAAEALLATFPQPHYRWRVPVMRAMLASLEGRFQEARALQREAIAICEEHQLYDGMIHALISVMILAYNRGDADGFEEEVAITRMLSQRGGGIFLSFNDAMTGRVDKARATIEHARTMNLDLQPGAATLGWVCVQAGLTEHIDFFYELATRRIGETSLVFGPAGLSTHGPTSLLLGRLAAMSNEHQGRAEGHLREAVAFSRRIRAWSCVAQSEVALAEVLAKRGAKETEAHAERGRATARELGMRVVMERAEKLLAEASKVTSPAPIAPARMLTLTPEGEMWSLTAGDRRLLLRDAKGLAYLQALLRRPHQEIHVLEILGAGAEGDAGPMLDARAKDAYRARAESLREELEEATAHADLGRVARIREELEALGDELSRAVGLGGRDRRAASGVERARVNVQRRLRDVIRRIAEQDRDLGRHLDLSVKTGVFCLYGPTWPDR